MKFIMTLVFLAVGPVVQGKVIFSQNFDKTPVGIYSANTVKNDFADVHIDQIYQGAIGDAVIVDSAEAYSGRSLRIHLSEKAKFGVYFRLPGVAENPGNYVYDSTYDDVYISYMYTTSPNFSLNAGGKMAGLAGSAYIRGYRHGGCVDDAKFSSKPHLGATDVGTCTSNHLYTAWYRMPKPCGGGSGFCFRDSFPGLNNAHGTWHHMEIRIKVNAPGKADGILQAWWDGDIILNNRSVEWRGTGAHNVERVRFEAIATGGHKPPHSENHYLYYDDLVIATTRQGPPGRAIPKVPSRPEGVSVTKQSGSR